jgi:hypothetical protein
VVLSISNNVGEYKDVLCEFRTIFLFSTLRWPSEHYKVLDMAYDAQTSSEKGTRPLLQPKKQNRNFLPLHTKILGKFPSFLTAEAICR